MPNEQIAVGQVYSLCINGLSVREIRFEFDGPSGDTHQGFTRKISGHDGAYKRTSALSNGDEVFNHRMWTALSLEELSEARAVLGKEIPAGCLLENMTVSGIPSFSKLAPTSRLVIVSEDERRQTILMGTEENGPCHKVGKRFAERYGASSLQADLINAMKSRRGLMGIVFSRGLVRVGDIVRVYPPVA